MVTSQRIITTWTNPKGNVQETGEILTNGYERSNKNTIPCWQCNINTAETVVRLFMRAKINEEEKRQTTI